MVGVRFTAPTQTVPEEHPDFCTMGNGTFLGVKWPGNVINNHPPHVALRLKKE
jgi:hypothetical protein